MTAYSMVGADPREPDCPKKVWGRVGASSPSRRIKAGHGDFLHFPTRTVTARVGAWLPTTRSRFGFDGHTAPMSKFADSALQELNGLIPVNPRRMVPCPLAKRPLIESALPYFGVFRW